MLLIVSASLLAYYDLNGHSLDPRDREIRLVVTGSMDAGPTDNDIPTIPKDCLVMIRHLHPDDMDDIAVGDVIAYDRKDSVIVHRVVSIDIDQRMLYLKGDANISIESVPFDDVRGKVVGVSHLLGEMVSILGSNLALVLALIGCILVMAVSLREILHVLKERNGNE